MKIEGRISIMVGWDGARIEIEDEKANTRFVYINMTAEQFMACLGRQACVECEIEVGGLDRVGKTHENSSFEFEIPDYVFLLDREERHKSLRKIAQDQLTDGWIADGYFGSKTSFFDEGGKKFARATIRRYI